MYERLNTNSIHCKRSADPSHALNAVNPRNSYYLTQLHMGYNILDRIIFGSGHLFISRAFRDFEQIFPAVRLPKYIV